MASIKHVAITGPPGVGKTTLVECVVERLRESSAPCSGFYTREVRKAGKRVGFDVVTLSGKSGVLSRAKPEGYGGREPRVGQYAVDLPAFESLALPLLQPQAGVGPHILVLDEIGKMEVLSRSFVSKVREVLVRPNTVLLTTIPIPKGKPIPLVEEIRSNKSFSVVNLTRENRDDADLLENIVSTLTASIKER